MSERLAPRDIAVNNIIYGFVREFGSTRDGWQSDKLQQENFEELIKVGSISGVSLAGARVLDVGCGFGDMAGLLLSQGVRTYEGIDLRSDAIVAARDENPFAFFQVQDFLTKSRDEKFDFVFCSGALTAKLPFGNKEYMERMIRKMWEMARVGIAFNYLISGEVRDDPVCHLFSREEVLDVVTSLTPSFRHFELSHMPEYQQDTVIVTKT